MCSRVVVMVASASAYALGDSDWLGKASSSTATMDHVD